MKTISDNELEIKLCQIYGLSSHNIPYYAYGDNQAACQMSHRLSEIQQIMRHLLFTEGILKQRNINEKRNQG